MTTIPKTFFPILESETSRTYFVNRVLRPLIKFPKKVLEIHMTSIALIMHDNVVVNILNEALRCLQRS